MVDLRARITVLVILLVFFTSMLSIQMFKHSSCTKCRFGELESGGYLVDSMIASEGQKMYGNYYADGAPLVLAILHEENYSTGEAVNCTKCAFYVFDIEDAFDMTISKDGIWYLVLSNPCRSAASYEYTWAVRTAADPIIDLICCISIPSFITLIVAQIVLIKKGKS